MNLYIYLAFIVGIISSFSIFYELVANYDYDGIFNFIIGCLVAIIFGIIIGAAFPLFLLFGLLYILIRRLKK